MDSPVSLLKFAVNENDSRVRTAHVVRACKIITDILPFDRKNHVLIEEPELMKYLMLSLPLNPRAIDLIISSMINKFKRLHYFLKELWLGFTTVAQMEEMGNVSVKKSESTLRLFQLGVKKLLKLSTLKDLDNLSNDYTARQSEYCDDVSDNKEQIKVAVLDYVEKVVDLYTRELKSSVAFKPDIPDLLKKFIIHSPSDKVIVKACSIIERVSFVEKNSMLNQEIEEVLINKQQSLVLDHTTPRKKNENNTAKPKVKFTTKGTMPSIAEIGHSAMENETSQRSNGKEKVKRLQSLPALNNSKRRDDFDNESQDVSIIEDLDDSVESIFKYLEGWLSSKDSENVPLIFRNINVHNLMKSQGNFEILLTFIFDPNCYQIGDCWIEKFPSMLDDFEDESGSLSYIRNSPDQYSSKLQKLKEDKSLHPYMMRSFKAMQALTDPKNLKYIAQYNPKIFENFFSFLYMCIATRDDSTCNYNHIATITEYLLRKESEVSTNYLIYYNLLYKFIQNIECPKVEQFLLVLFNCSYTSNRVSDKAYTRLMKYCQIASFFTDLAQAILVGPTGLDTKKCEINYKPPGIEELLNGTMKNVDFESLFDESSNPTPAPGAEPEQALLDEEFDGLSLDVDSLYHVINSGQQVDKKKLNIQKQAQQKDLSEKTVNRYASLREKYGCTHDETLLGSQLDGRTEEDSDGESELKDKVRMTLPAEDNNRRIMSEPNEISKPLKILTSGGKTAVIIQTKKPAALTLNLPGQSPKNFQFLSPIMSADASVKLGLLKAPEKSIHSTLKQVPTETRLKTTEPSLRDIAKHSNDGSRAEGFKAMKGGRATPSQVQDLASMSLPQIRTPSRVGQSKQTLPSRPNLDHTRGSKHEDVSRPERLTLAKEFLTDTITLKEAQQLNSLYPFASGGRVETEIDKEAKKQEYTLNSIRINDTFSIPLCNLFESLFHKALSCPTKPTNFEDETLINLGINEDQGKKMRYEANRKLGHFDADYSSFWTAVFDKEAKVFEKLLKNYLLKIKIHHLEENNSGYIAGRIVNMLLKKCETHEELKKFSKPIHNICREHIKFLSKVIIQSHAWSQPKDLKINLQNHEVTDPVGTGRILLAETLYLIIKNDSSNNYSVVNEINDTCWHTLVTWFFNKKTNNVYQQIFYSIMKLGFINAGEKFILNIIQRMELLSKMYKMWIEIYPNNVLVGDNYMESMIYYIKKLAKLIDTVSYEKEQYATLRGQLMTSVSWNFLRQRLGLVRTEKKKSTKAQDKRRHSKMRTRDVLDSTSSIPNERRSIVSKTRLLMPKDYRDAPSSINSLSSVNSKQ